MHQNYISSEVLTGDNFIEFELISVAFVVERLLDSFAWAFRGFPSNYFGSVMKLTYGTVLWKTAENSAFPPNSATIADNNLRKSLDVLF